MCAAIVERELVSVSCTILLLLPSPVVDRCRAIGRRETEKFLEVPERLLESAMPTEASLSLLKTSLAVATGAEMASE
jgi:hypothetical protein